MKRISKIFLIAAMAALLLTGCYKQDTTIKVSPLGKVTSEVSFLGSDEAIEEISGGMTYDELMDEIIPQIEQMIDDNPGESIEKISETAGETQLNGLKFKATYGSVSEMLANDLFGAFNQSVAVPVTSAEIRDSANGVQLRPAYHWYGTEYYVNGNLSITQGQVLTEEEESKLTEANTNMTFKFPFTSFSASAGNKNILAPKFAFTADNTNPDVPIHFYVFTPNIPLLIAALIILLLLIRLFIISGKFSKLSDKLAAAGTAAVNAAENAGEAALNFAGEAKDAAEDFADAAAEKINDIKDAAEEFINSNDKADTDDSENE